MSNETYAITKEKRTILCELIEKDGFPNQPALDLLNSLPLITGDPCNEDLATDIDCIDARHRGDPSYEHDAYYMRDAAAKLIRTGYPLYTHAQPTEQAIKDARKQALKAALDLFPQGFAMLSTNQVREIIRGLLK